MPKSVALLKFSRVFHLYSGVFITPALIFFAITGALQTFSFHETTRGSNYKPPAILVELGQLHKKQTLVVAERKPARPDTASSAPPATQDPLGDNPRKRDRAEQAKPVIDAPSQVAPAPVPQKVHNLLPMKIFFLLVSIGLFLSTLTGLYMSYKYVRNKLLVTLTLIAGIAVPLLLLLF